MAGSVGVGIGREFLLFSAALPVVCGAVVCGSQRFGQVVVEMFGIAYHIVEV